ncbi:hypothetical protein [uncultured Oscillibacter sp.]|uniref:hypothetical protein n=1 Tax=uncultured Oscillibacter sp. TaxID=876091 RepID=UPI0026241BAE|nr:hypothetical protein [uncultured Oscillibacter sp.]
MENAMDMGGIIARLCELGAYSIYKAEFESIRSVREKDAEACREAAGILSALLDGGCKTVEDTKDLVHDYNALAKQYQAMYKRHGTAGHAVHKDGVWHCPDCNRRVHPHHAFCHSCGKKLGGNGGKGGRRYG